MVVNLIAAVWGFCEAVFFFIVPDVFLSAVALKDPKRAGVALVWALAGAVGGGIYLFNRAIDDPGREFRNLLEVPAISQPLVADVSADVAEDGVAAMLTGPLRGIPYKIFVVQLAVARTDVTPFIAMSILARALRFAAVTALGLLAGHLMRRWSFTGRLGAHLLLWSLFYGFYFWKMGP